MFRYLKIGIRKLIPLSMQVPLKYWYSYFRGYSEPEMRLLKRLVKNETMAIDIGGNRGIYSYHISKFCCNIEIFEPNPVCFDILKLLVCALLKIAFANSYQEHDSSPQ